jgi:hypothetical protein
MVSCCSRSTNPTNTVHINCGEITRRVYVNRQPATFSDTTSLLPLTVQAAPLHSCKYRRLHAPQPKTLQWASFVEQDPECFPLGRLSTPYGGSGAGRGVGAARAMPAAA